MFFDPYWHAINKGVLPSSYFLLMLNVLPIILFTISISLFIHDSIINVSSFSFGSLWFLKLFDEFLSSEISLNLFNRPLFLLSLLNIILILFLFIFNIFKISWSIFDIEFIIFFVTLFLLNYFLILVFYPSSTSYRS